MISGFVCTFYSESPATPGSNPKQIINALFMIELIYLNDTTNCLLNFSLDFEIEHKIEN